MDMNGGSSASYLACTLVFPCFVLCLIGLEAEGLFDYQGTARIHCTVEPSPGHVRCRLASQNPPFAKHLKRDWNYKSQVFVAKQCTQSGFARYLR